MIVGNCHETFLIQENKLDNHEIVKLASVLEKKGDNGKLDSQIKAEIIVALDTYLGRQILRERLDPDSMKYLKTCIESQSYSRLPKVRSLARELWHKLKNAALLDVNRPAEMQLNNAGENLPRIYSERNERVYIKPQPTILQSSESEAKKLVDNHEAKNQMLQKPSENPQITSPKDPQPSDIGKTSKGVENEEVKEKDQVDGQKAGQVNKSGEDKIEENKQQLSNNEGQTKQSEGLNAVNEDKKQDDSLGLKDMIGMAHNISATSFALQTQQLGASGESADHYNLGASPQLRQKRDEMKMKKQPAHTSTLMDREQSDISDLKRGMFLIEDPLLRMTRGKGWGPNIRAKNYLKKFSGLGPFGGGGGEGEDSFQSEKLVARKEMRQKQRSELHCMFDKDKKEERSKSKSVPKFGLLDEGEEKKRKRRLLLISKGLDPDDVGAEEKLKQIIEKENLEEQEKSNPFIKSNLNSSRSQKETRQFYLGKGAFRGNS